MGEVYLVVPGSDQFYRLGCHASLEDVQHQQAFGPMNEVKGREGWSTLTICGSDYCNSFASHPEERDRGIYRDHPENRTMSPGNRGHGPVDRGIYQGYHLVDRPIVIMSDSASMVSSTLLILLTVMKEM